MKKIIIYTCYDCLIKTRQEECFLETNQHLVIESEENVISVYPTGKSNKFSFNIDLDNHKSNLYSIIERENRILVFLLDGLLVENVRLFNFLYKNQKSSVEISSQNIIFKTESNKKIISLPNSSSDFLCGEFLHILFVKFSDSQNQKLIAYNTLSNKAKMFSGQNIEITDDGFVVDNEKSTSRNQTKSEYYVDGEGLKIRSKTMAQTTKPSPCELISFEFMEAVKNNDYQTALSYLSENLKEDINAQSLKEYFGDVSYFYPIDKNTCFAISDNQNTLFEFLIKDDKISEISDFH